MTRRATPLTTDDVVRAARRLIESGGVEACSMRALASELGVQPPALYRRVHDKDELLSRVLADVLGDIAVPADGSWQERVAELMRRMRAIVRRHPNLLGLYLRSHLQAHDARRLALAGSTPLLEAGFSTEAATFAVTVLSMYTLGMTTVGVSLGVDDDAMFEFGLIRIIDGLTRGGTDMEAVERLEAIEAIKQLKARYFRCMDTKDWDGMRQVFTDDVVIDTTEDAGGEAIAGADVFMPFLRSHIENVTTTHHGHMPEIQITSPTTATGIWAMEDMLRWPEGGPIKHLHGYGHYHETYEKTATGWRIKSLTLTRLRVDFDMAD